MSTQLQEAVQLAQQGRRDDARRMLWQVAQSEPNNEMAWLWLASVAADQAEYQRALNEVLRINPDNQQARQLLADFQKQQQPAVPPIPPVGSSAPTQFGQPAPRPPQYGAPYPPPAYGQQPQQQPPYPPYGQPQQPSAYGPGGGPYAPYPYMPAPAPKRRSGCGCLPRSCAIALVLILVVPTLLCCIIAATPKSLGPFDIAAEYLPGQFGRKSIEYQDANIRVKATVPRGWFPAVTGDTTWEAMRDSLQNSLPFENSALTWKDAEVDLKTGGSVTSVSVLELNPYELMTGGAPITLQLTKIVSPSDMGVTDFSCQNVRTYEATLTQSATEGSDVISTKNGLCALRSYTIQPNPGQTRIFKDYDAPDKMRMVTMIIPIDKTNAAEFMLSIPDSQYGNFKDDMTKFIKSADVTLKNKTSGTVPIPGLVPGATATP